MGHDRVTVDAHDRFDRRLKQAERLYARRGRVFRLLWVLAGVVVVLAGLPLLVLPGPAILVILIGLAMLAAPFAPVRRLLRGAVALLGDLEERARRTGPRTRLAAALLLLAGAGAAVSFVLTR